MATVPPYARLSLTHAGEGFWKTADVSAPGLTTRCASSADVDAVLAFWKRAAENAERPADSAEAVTRLIARDPDALLLVCDGERIVAMVLDSNRRAHELWSRAGYTRQSNWARWVKPIGRRAMGA
jgi:hypothetical protein